MFRSAQHIKRVLSRYGIIAATVVVTVGFTLFRSQTYSSASVLVPYNSNNVWNQPIVSVPQKSQPFGRNTARGSTDLPSIPGNWNLIFSDTFQSMTLDTGKWNTCYWWATNGGCTNAGNSELEWYQPDDVIPTAGGLRLQAQKRSVSGYNYTSGMVSTFGKFSFKYGYMEAKMKIPAGQGLWPAFWALPTVQNMWPPELDVMEILGHQPSVNHMTVHWSANGVNGQDGSAWTGPDFSTAYHTFGLDWEPTALTWYIDGAPYKVFTDTTKIPALPMYLLANLAVGGNWPGAPNSSTVFPSYADIQYIKVWQSAVGVAVTPIPPTATPVPPIATSVPPANTPVPPTATPLQPTATPAKKKHSK